MLAVLTATVNMFEVPAAEGSLIDNKASINTSYASNDLGDEQDFIPVIDAIRGEGFQSFVAASPHRL